MKAPSSKTLNILDLGLRRYGEVLQIQELLAEQRTAGIISDTLILVEHPAVITRGVKAKDSSIKISAEKLREEGIEVYDILRGGAAFLHNPGQLVGYPIVLLEQGSRRHYLESVQQSMIDVARCYGVAAGCHPREEYVGVWYQVAPGLYHKIGAVGIFFKKIAAGYVTLHGFAFNVNNDIKQVERLIYMCGCDRETCVSLREIRNVEIAMAQVKKDIVAALRNRLDYQQLMHYDSIEQILENSYGKDEKCQTRVVAGENKIRP